MGAKVRHLGFILKVMGSHCTVKEGNDRNYLITVKGHFVENGLASVESGKPSYGGNCSSTDKRLNNPKQCSDVLGIFHTFI